MIQASPTRWRRPAIASHALTHAACVAACIALWLALPAPLALVLLVPLWCAIAWLDHAALTRLHEAAHGTLAKPRWLNELVGITIGTASLTPLSVYRHVHHRHHAHLAGPADPEFWPYNLPGSPRWLRLVYAWLEITIGWLFTPLLYSVRTAAEMKSMNPTRQRRLFGEWSTLVVFWGVLLLSVIDQGWWPLFVVGHLVPAWLAGTLQTLRKFTEHTILAMTRTVVYTGSVGRAASTTQLHVEHHGTHHRRARIPWNELPDVTPTVYAT